MNKLQRIVAPILILLLVGVISASWNVSHSKADPAPLPTTLSASGSVAASRSLYLSGFIQPTGNWTINLDYTPLNGSASVTVTTPNGTIIDNKMVATSSPGSLTMNENYTQPVRIHVYASSWKLSAR